MKKGVWLTDFDLKGSGYKNLSSPLCAGLTEKGYEIKVLGLGYKGSEHSFPFSVIPADNVLQTVGMIHNLSNLWNFDFLVIALDIPLQERIMQQFKNRDLKIVGIMPVEGDPLIISWANILLQMEKPFIISEFGANEARKAGVERAEHLPVGIDLDIWELRTKEEIELARKTFGFQDDTFVVLTVADNQERKHLSRSMEIFADFVHTYDVDAKYILVTREHLSFGWKLRDYALELNIASKIMIFERGIPEEDLRSIYALSDAFLLCSKAEGCGIPILEAMACGVPVLATNATAMKEHLADGRGYPLVYDYTHRDPFGNSTRYFVDRQKGVEALHFAFRERNSKDQQEIVKKAREYIEARPWSKSVDLLDKRIQEIE